jgi:hypothetical protein
MSLTSHAWCLDLPGSRCLQGPLAPWRHFPIGHFMPIINLLGERRISEGGLYIQQIKVPPQILENLGSLLWLSGNL